MTTMQIKPETSIETSRKIPATNEQHEDEFQVSVQLTNRKTKCYTTSNSDGWKSRVRSFVKRVDKESSCRIDTVRISHVKGGERFSEKHWRGDELSFTDYLSQ